MTAELIYALIGTVMGLILGAVLTIITTERTLSQQKKAWARERLYDAYSNSIYYLFKLSLSIKGDPQLKDKDARQHVSEAQRFLLILAAYTANDANFQQEVGSYVNSTITDQTTLNMLKIVKAKLQSDDRIVVKL